MEDLRAALADGGQAVLTAEPGAGKTTIVPLRLLESQGLLKASPRRGFFVRELSAQDVDELYDLRLCVERHAAVEAARR